MQKKILRVLVSAFCLVNLTTVCASGATVPTEIIGGSTIEEIDSSILEENNLKYNIAQKSARAITATSKINYIGNFRQEKNYSCGPATIRNLAQGYVSKNGGTVPSEATLIKELGTTTSGTALGSTFVNVLNKYVPGNNYTLQLGTGFTQATWETKLRNIMPYTINKAGNYGVVVNLYHGSQSAAYCVNDFYAGKSVAHYVAAYGYSDGRVYISDSNNYMTGSRLYDTGYYSLAKSSISRGVIW
ncbi:MAG: C39 family peptidase [Clostridium perfringens]|nr:C39 family peptidase [Clostridium perfringens]